MRLYKLQSYRKGMKTCCKCGLTSASDNFGYLTRSKRKKPVCYSCCAEMDKEQMVKTGSIGLYFVLTEIAYTPCKSQTSYGYCKVTNWPGSLVFKGTWVKNGHNWYMVKRYDIWFNGPDGHVWYGKLIQGPCSGEWVRFRRTKEMWRKAKVTV